jgi:hypothetical protein
MISPGGQRLSRSPDLVRAEVVERLEARRPEIEEAILARAYSVSNPVDDEDAEYLAGLKEAVAAAVGYGLAGIQLGEEHLGPIPAQVIVQVRHAARNRVGMEVVLRRYFAGYTALGDFLMQESQHDSILSAATTFHRLQKELAAIFDRVVASVAAEYRHEIERFPSPPGRRIAERVKRLLAGELVDTAELAYDLDAWHIGAIAAGPGALKLLRVLADMLDCRLLLVADSEDTVWAWLGARHKFKVSELECLSLSDWPPDVSLALGEPARGLRGWRLTHRQAEAAHTVARRCPETLTRYGEVALLASTLQDNVLATSLAEIYLAPLHDERDGGTILRQTLRAYFAAERNASSAAAALGVSRQTVHNRLHATEERLGRPLSTCAAEMEAALRLADLSERTPQPGL